MECTVHSGGSAAPGVAFARAVQNPEARRCPTRSGGLWELNEGGGEGRVALTFCAVGLPWLVSK